MNQYFKYQLETAKPLTKDDVTKMVNARISAGISFNKEEILSWEGRTFLYYFHENPNEKTVEIKRIFADELDYLNQYEYIGTPIQNIPRFRDVK